MKCSNCPDTKLALNSVLCAACLDLYYHGHPVKGRFGTIQSNAGPPEGYKSPEATDGLPLFAEAV